MKKLIAALILLVILLAGFEAGKLHAITHMQAYIVELPTVSDDEIPLYIDLDGQLYETGLTIC